MSDDYDRKCIKFSLAWVNGYKPKGKTYAQFAEDYRLSVKDAKKYIKHGTMLLN